MWIVLFVFNNSFTFAFKELQKAVIKSTTCDLASNLLTLEN